MDFWHIEPGVGGTAMELGARYEIPVTRCTGCGGGRQSWRVLPVECPPEWRGRPEVTRQGRNDHRVHSSEFEALRAAVEPAVHDALGPRYRALLPLQPGDRFEPVQLVRGPRPR